MTRKKIKLAWIGNDSARKASFRKRRAGLLKKVSELTTLCAVDAFVVVYGPDDDEPAVWPSREEAQQLLTRFQSVPEIERCRKMMNQESYLRERTTKVQDQLRKQHKKSKEVEMGHIMRQLDQGKKLGELETSELTSLAWYLDEKMKDCRKRQEYYPKSPLPPGSFPSQESAPAKEPGPMGGSTAAEGKSPTEFFTWDQWLADIVNQNEGAAGTSSIRSTVGLPPHAYVGDPSGASDMRLPYGDLGGGGGMIEMELPRGNYRGSRGGREIGGLPYASFGFHSGVGGDVGLRLPFDGNMSDVAGGSDMVSGVVYDGTLSVGVGGSDMGFGLAYPGNMNLGAGGSDMGLGMDYQGNMNLGEIGSNMGLGMDYHGNMDPGAGGSDMGLGMVDHGNMDVGAGGCGMGLGMPHGNIGTIGAGGSDMGLGMPHGKTGTIGAGASDTGLGMPHGNIGSSRAGGSDMGLPQGLSEGSLAGGDAGLPYDVTNPWHTFFSP